jgi:IMP dehydrogenase
MNTNGVTVSEDATMVKANMIMKENHVRGLPVVDKKHRLVGIITDREQINSP